MTQTRRSEVSEMGRKPTGNPMGRPKKQIDKKAFESLCGLQCTLEEICDFFGVTDKTIESWCKREYGCTFSVIFRQKRNLGKISLRRAGFEMAKKVPSVHMFYAKNYLGMTDRVEQSIEVVEDLQPLADLLNEESDD